MLLLTPPEQAADLAFLLEEEGHEPCFWPVLGAPGELPLGLRAVAEHVHRLTWVVAIGRGPLRAFLEAINRAGTRRALQKLQWLAADAPTARAIERFGGTVRVPGDGKWTSAVSGLLTSDDDVLVLHAGQAPEILLDSLDAAGIGFTQVAVAPAASLALPPPAHGVVIVHSAAAGEAFIELTRGLPEAAPSAAQCCGPVALEAGPLAPLANDGLRIVATTPAAAAALASLGVEVYVTAAAPAADAVVDAALRALSE